MCYSNKWAILAAASLSALSASYASATALIYAGPGYVDNGSGTAGSGYRGPTIDSNPGLSVGSATGVGKGIGYETFYTGGRGTGTISNAFVIDPTVASGPFTGNYTILSQVPGSTSGYSATAINTNATLIAGTAKVSAASPSSTGAVVWTPDGTPYVLPLPTFTGSVAAPNSTARGINNAGTVVGGGGYFTAAGSQGFSNGYVYYNSNFGVSTTPSYSGGTAVHLAPLGLSNANATNNQSVSVNGISTDGVAAGASSQSSSGSYATFWNVGNTAPGGTTIAGNMLSVTAPAGLSTLNATGAGGSSAVAAIGTGGVAGGTSLFFASGTSNSAGFQPVRWTPASGTILSTSDQGVVLSVPSGYTQGSIFAVNAGGAAVGSANNTNPVSGGVQPATRTLSAELWKAGSTTATPLNPVGSPTVNFPFTSSGPGGSLINSNNGYVAKGINDNGYSVGWAQEAYNNSNTIDALTWDPNGNVTELNSQISLVSASGSTAGWVSLVQANSITNDGWISGVGVYFDPAVKADYISSSDPVGTYGAGTYYREFLLQDTAAVPEPVSVATLLVLAATSTLRRRRANQA